MNTALMRRRLEKIEATMIPPQPMAILFEPEGDPVSAPDSWAAHRWGIDEARTRGDRIGVVVFTGPAKTREPVEGVQYFDTGWEAELAALLRDGVLELRDSLLGDVFGAATGGDRAQGEGCNEH